MFRRSSACVSVMVLLVLAGCQDSGPFGLDADVEKGPAFELFDGGWAAVTGPLGEPNLLVNGEFEAPFAPEWSATLLVSIPPWSEWEIAAFDIDPFPTAGFPDALTPHDEPLDASIPADGDGASAQVFANVATLAQSVVLPALGPGETLWLSYQNRIKNFAGTGFPMVGDGTAIWNADPGVVTDHDYRVEIDAGGGPVVLWSAAAVGAPAFSGGGDDVTAFYIAESFDISAFAGNSVDLSFIIAAGPALIVDLDDIVIYVEEAPGGDPTPVIDFTGLDVTDAKVKIHKKGKKDKHPKDKDEFEIKKGQLTMSKNFNGFDLDNNAVTINFGGIAWVIEAGSFVRKRRRHPDDDNDDEHGGWRFRGEKPGITHVDIDNNGKFKIKGKDLNLFFIDLKPDGQTVDFSLKIGNDTGGFPIKFDKKGRFKVKKDKKGKKHDDDDDD